MEQDETQQGFTTKPIYQSLITTTFESRLKEIIEERDALSEKFVK